MSRSWAWLVLTLLFLDEVLAVVALGYVGGRLGGWAGGIAVAGVAVALWWGLASPKAPWGGRVRRRSVKVLVFGAACLGLWWAGHVLLAALLLGFSVAVNGLAQDRGVRRVLASEDR